MKPNRVWIFAAYLWGCLAWGGIVGRVVADSALPMLSGFDADRISSTYPPANEETRGELSKLIFRLRSVDPKFLSKAAATEATRLGDAVTWEGTIESISALTVPADLVEYLDLRRLEVIDVVGSGETLRVITSGVSGNAKPGDRVAGTGILINLNSPKGRVLAAPNAQWYPETPPSVGWTLLSGQGVDIGSLSGVAGRNKLPLSAADSDAFYTMIAAAGEIGTQTDTPTPTRFRPVALLEKPEQHSGKWIRVALETVQVTRVAVTDPLRQKQLGSDHYFQIDAVGNLGKIKARIDRPPGDDRPAAVFANRYPVSIVTGELPAFLDEQIRERQGGQTMVAEIGVPITVDAFFFRIWSYSTEYMNRFGGGDQLGPLLIGARVEPRPQGDDPAGVGIIGWLAAGGILLAILAIWIWDRVVGRSDRQAREERKQRQAEQLQLPDETAV